MILRYALASIVLFAQPLAAGTDPDVPAMLKRADRSRGHVDQGLEYQIQIDCEASEMKPLRRTYKVRSKGVNALATVTEPPEKKGDSVLVNGRLVWQMQSTSKRPIAVTLADRMGGGMASVGDIISTGFADIYAGQAVADGAIEAEPMMRLDLTAIKQGKAPATFEKARFWVGAKTGLGRKVEFLGASGSVMKTVSFAYANELKVGAETLPFVSLATIKNSDSTSVCTIAYSPPSPVDIGGDEFDLKRLAPAKAP